jgi:hypothetical protein
MPTTPTYALPYPAASDPADVPIDMQELADRLEVVMPTLRAKLPLLTALPGSPVDGDEVIFTNSLTNPAWAFHLRYVAAATRKWWCIGGVPHRAETNPAAVLTLATWITGASLVAPAPGLYIVTVSASAQLGATATAGLFGPGIVGAGAPVVNYQFGAAAGVYLPTVQATVTATAGQSICTYIQQTGGTAGTLNLNRLHAMAAYLD